MKRKIVFPGILLLAVFVYAAGCKKSTPARSNTEVITQSAWKFDNAKVAGTDVSSFLQACQKDNTILFASDGNGVADEGSTKCADSDPQSTAFTWEFQMNNTILHASATLFAGGNGDFTVLSLTDTKLVVSQAITLAGTTQTAIITLIH